MGILFLANDLSLGFFGETVARRCLGGVGLVLLIKGLNLIFLVWVNVGLIDFLFWVEFVCVMGLSRKGRLVGPFSMSSILHELGPLHVLGPLKWFGPIKDPDGLFKKAEETLKRRKASVRIELGSVLGVG